MTDDRTLLEKAARAAGIELDWYEVGSDNPDCDAGWWCDIKGTQRTWSPLTNDGDALRLAVKLRLEIVPVEGGYIDVCLPGSNPFACACERSDDRCAATRRAIVRVAASLGSLDEAGKD